jgi:hypothetical protein
MNGIAGRLPKMGNANESAVHHLWGTNGSRGALANHCAHDRFALPEMRLGDPGGNRMRSQAEEKIENAVSAELRQNFDEIQRICVPEPMAPQP